MKRFLLILPFLLNAGILNEYKQKELNLENKLNSVEAKKTKKSWINPIIIQYQYLNTTSYNDKLSHQQTFSISLNQPIFKSGAIYYSIKYANDLKNLNKTNLILKRNTLIKNALSLAYDYKIANFEKQILILQIENAKIDVKRKKDAFKEGTIDLTFLNNAMLNLNNLKLSLEDLNFNLEEIKSNFKNISSLDIDRVNLPKFKIINKKEFFNQNLDLKSKKEEIKVNKDLHKMQIGNTLFTISFIGSWNYQKDSYLNSESNFYNVGLGVSIPIDFNAKEKIEKTKLQILKSNVNLLDKKNELKNEFLKIVNQIKILQRKIKIYKDNIDLYNGLINSTIEAIKSGDKTKEDLEILKNSQKTNYLNIKILKLKIQKLLLTLYYKTINFK